MIEPSVWSIIWDNFEYKIWKQVAISVNTKATNDGLSRIHDAVDDPSIQSIRLRLRDKIEEQPLET